MGKKFEQTCKLDPADPWRWENDLADEKYEIFDQYGKRESILPFSKWEELVEKKISMSILPPMLRSELLDVIRSVAAEADRWLKEHFPISLRSCEQEQYAQSCFQWSSLGKINRLKTAKTLLTNPRLHIDYLYSIAKHYDLMENTLSHRNTNLMCPNFMEGDEASRRSRSGAGAICEKFFEKSTLKYIAWPDYFAKSAPDQYLQYIQKVMSENYIEYEDLLFCLSHISEDEREIIFKKYALRILMYFLDWPLQSEFLYAAKHLLPYFTGNNFRDILTVILYERIMLGRKDFNYISLLKEFWAISPLLLRRFIETNSIYKILMHTMNYPIGEVFPHQKLFESFHGTGLMFGYQGMKYVLIRLETPDKSFVALNCDHFTPYLGYKFCSITYVYKLRRRKRDKALQTQTKERRTAFISKLRDLCHWPNRPT
ncbi:uncharacterized protein NPIL_282991 [Nephila pilipes]|nr:uncharacterized protein NPIL_282991 [Nephila pilipes]